MFVLKLLVYKKDFKYDENKNYLVKVYFVRKKKQ